MKVICQGNETANVLAIQSVCVGTASKRIKVCVKHETGKINKQKVSCLAYPILKSAIRLLPKSAKTIAKELKDLSKDPDRPVEKVVELDAWAWGYLQVELDINNETSVRGLARLCWDWVLSQNPTDEQLKFRTGLSTDDIQKVVNTDIYKAIVEKSMLERYNTADKFKWWVRDYGKNMPTRFGRRMRLSEDTATELINSVAEQHDVDLGNLKGSSTVFESEKTNGSGSESVYLYYYQWDREIAESKGEKVWECKIGSTKRTLEKRIKEIVTYTDKFRIGLHIRTDEPGKKIEETIQDILKEREKCIDESLRTEWFLTSPCEVEEIYNFIGENSHERASSTLS